MIQTVQILLATTLANCAAFRTLVGAADATAALPRIYHDSFPPPPDGADRYSAAQLATIRPCALVYTEDGKGYVIERDAMGTDCWHGSGILHAVIYRTVPAAIADDPGEVDRTFRVIIGDIITQLVAQSETAERLASRKITVSGPYRTPPDELQVMGDEQAYDLMLEWGVQ